MEGALSINLALAAGAGSTDSVLMLAAGAFMLYIVMRQWMRKKKPDPLASAPSSRMSLKQQKAVERDMQNLLVELHDMARQMTAQIETRVSKLEILLSEADEKIARLEALGSSSADSVTKPQAAETPDTPIDRPAMRLARPPEPNIEAPDDRYAEVYRLNDQGLDARAISQKLSRPAGEIELILALRPRPRAALDAPDVDISEPPAIASA
ncbi:MAG: hypothetical protein QM770_06115 [Tepidisphaeraceae bacterium]